MKSWSFANRENGGSYGEGWQGYEYQARAHAQALADEHGVGVDYWETGDLSQDDGACASLQSVEPE